MNLPGDIEDRTAAYKQYLEIYNYLESGDLRASESAPLVGELSAYIANLQTRFESLAETCPDYLIDPFDDIAHALSKLLEAVKNLQECAENGKLQEVKTEWAWEAEKVLRQTRDQIIALHRETSGEDLSHQFRL